MFEYSREDIVSNKWIQRQRKAMGMSVSELARRVGCSDTTIHKIEAGVSNPTWPTVLAIAAELGIAIRLEWVGLPMLKEN
jgi:DNA-binding XRE family transcriptional regulator